MERRKIKETIHTIRYDWEDAPLKVCDIPKDLLPDDEIYCHSEPGYNSENDSWDAFTEYNIVRLRDQTDEEYKKDLEWWDNRKEESRKLRYENYLKLKKEFEEGLLTRGKYKMSEEELKAFEQYSGLL